jgi:hypothetical protein
MDMREQAAMRAAAKRNWRACAQWRTDRVGASMFGSRVASDAQSPEVVK